MNDKYLQEVEERLKEYGLKTSDCTPVEVEEMLEEVRDLENDEYMVLDGYFGGSFELFNIQMRKQFIESELNEKGLSLKDISSEEYDRLKDDYHKKLSKL